ncbi:Cocaine esterase [Colletotrichum fructicola]|nr:Cocaine esterase [Colletotrichum fructicola]
MDELRQASNLWYSLRPLLSRAVTTCQIFNPQCTLVPADSDILCQYDVGVVLPDGTKLLANVFRSRRAEEDSRKVPVVMCAHPYDNHKLPALGKTPLGGPPHQYRLIPQAGGKPKFSNVTSWESPDPNLWVPAGYAVVNLNLPGFSGSEGMATVMSDNQSKAYYEAIEWVARQPWCDGAVGLNGVSFLAITQFHVAACRHYGGPPPALKCIVPWERLTDPHQDSICPGGIEDAGFLTFWWHTEVKPALTGSAADFIKDNDASVAGMLVKHPLMNTYWREKAAPVDDIELPMLVCGSFSDHCLHTQGSFRAFTRARSRHKWIYTHRGGKWDVFYSPEVQHLTKQFMDCFVKGESNNGFLSHPPVTLEVRSSRDVIHERRGEKAWPLPGVTWSKLRLGPSGLSRSNPEKSTELCYECTNGQVSFDFRFDQDTELTGEMKLRLWAEVRGKPGQSPVPNDLFLFTAVDKRDVKGKPVRFHGSVGFTDDWVTRGFCRASRRELDQIHSKPWLPVSSGISDQPLRPGEIVQVDIALYPSSTFFSAGESIRLVICGQEIIRNPPYHKKVAAGPEKCVMHVDGKYDSFLLVPESSL